ncbi:MULTISPECIES: hypothetical protein [Gelidibacter]|uniref:O-antigen ligase-like membrane protein n=1 Tax=Gelidibacter pelagius TaxID=2819985 RepID=A0ABS3SM13_9FLAO|nr:hypothetical protein [Gelidibacter pelagius]MBO3096745.1 hypothetical protein [Gelidibacter pelagius]
MYITKSRLLKWGLYSNAIYILLFFLLKPDGFGFQKVVISMFFLFSVFSIYFLCIKDGKQLNQLSTGNRWVIYLLLFWGVIVIVKSFTLNPQDWITNFGNVYMGFAWLMPAITVLGLKIENWTVMFKSISFMFTLMIGAFLFLSVLTINDEWIWLLRPLVFVLIIGFNRFTLIKKIQILIIIVVYMVVSTIGERRMEYLWLIMVFGFLIMDRVMSFRVRRTFIKYIIAGFLLVLTLIFTLGYEYVWRIVTMFADIQDSRTFLFRELMSELNFSEKIFGRGSLGTYYSEYFEHTKWYVVDVLKKPWYGDSSTRITIEVGYLQMILKGGFIMMLLNLIILISSSYVAIFKSRNKFIKRLGYYILIFMILYLIELRPTFTPIFFILWMAIGTVLNKKYRLMDDEEINALIKF